MRYYLDVPPKTLGDKNHRFIIENSEDLEECISDDGIIYIQRMEYKRKDVGNFYLAYRDVLMVTETHENTHKKEPISDTFAKKQGYSKFGEHFDTIAVHCKPGEIYIALCEPLEDIKSFTDYLKTIDGMTDKKEEI